MVGVFLLVILGGVVALVGGDDDGDDGGDASDTTEQTERTDDVSVPAASTPDPDATSPDETVNATDPPSTQTTPEDTEPVDTEAPDTTPPEDTEPEDTEPDGPAEGEIASAPDGRTGTRDDPVPVTELADIGGGWRLQVLEVIPDGTAAVMEENQFNEEPPAGSAFTLVRVALGYFGVDEPTSTFYPSIGMVGAANVELDRDCGVVPDEFYTFSDLFAGGVAVGNMCAITTPEDLPVLTIYANGDLFSVDDPVFVATTPAPEPGSVEVLQPLRGPQPGAKMTPAREAAGAIGTTVELDEGWSFTVTAPAVDITDAVLAENQFNEPPPPGHRFVGVDVTYAYNGPEPTATPFVVSTKAVGSANQALTTDCGVLANMVDIFSDLFPGGQVSGQFCFVVPEEDVASGAWQMYVSAGFESEPVFLAIT